MIIVGRLIGRIDGRYLILFGFIVLAFSNFLFADINLQIAMRNVVWPNIISGFAMGFIFVPLTTVSMGTLSNAQMGNAAGIFNLMRNTGGSIGIAAVTTMLARGAQRHQATLASHLTPYDPAFRQGLQQMQGAMAMHGNPATAAEQAHAALYGMLVRQSMVMSYIDNFRLLAYLCLLCVPAVFLFKRIRARKGPVAMH